MSKEKKQNKFMPEMVTGPCRIIMASGRVIAGTPVGWLDNAIVMESVSSDTVIIRMEQIESVWDGLISPRAAESLKQEDIADGTEKEGMDGLQKS